jgi:hypothetical protein
MTRGREEDGMAHQFHRLPPSTLCAALVAILGYSALWPAIASGNHQSARASDDENRIARETFEAALELAGLSAAKLPIVMTSVMPDTLSPGTVGWTSVGRNGKGERIFVYSNSAAFRCARARKDRQCLLKVASVIVHEAWHFRHGGGEGAAYTAQILFLMANDGALEEIADVRRSRDRAVIVERQAIDAARKLSRNEQR